MDEKWEIVEGRVWARIYMPLGGGPMAQAMLGHGRSGRRPFNKGSRNKSESVGLNKETRYTRERHLKSRRYILHNNGAVHSL